MEGAHRIVGRFLIADRFFKTALSLLWLCCVATVAARCVAGEVERVRPHAVPPRDFAAIEKAIDRGIAFLVADQNPDGSWGSAERTKDLNIYAPIPGAHHAFRTATTALCISALIESKRDSTEVKSSLDRAEAWMFDRVPHLRRATAEAMYNNWGHAYAITALVRMHQRAEGDKQRQAKILELIASQIDRLQRYEGLDGGWGYYDFDAHTQHPKAMSTSFMTASVLIAMREADLLGVKTEQKFIDRGLDSIRRQLKPDYSYLYGEYLHWKPLHPVNQPNGSLGRSQACNVALRTYGEKRITDEALTLCLDRLFARNGWLDMGRKRPVPHESYYAVAGYFYYYGHYYAALAIDMLPAAQRAAHRDQLVARLAPLQEKDGSWWDYPLYNYHQQYGTAFGVLTLVHCRQ